VQFEHCNGINIIQSKERLPLTKRMARALRLLTGFSAMTAKNENKAEEK
jgi:hypothetical protein